MSFLEKIKYEISLLGGFAKLTLKLIYYVSIYTVLYKLLLPFLKYYLPKNLRIDDYENISGFTIIILGVLTYFIGKYLKHIFKKS